MFQIFFNYKSKIVFQLYYRQNVPPVFVYLLLQRNVIFQDHKKFAQGRASFGARISILKNSASCPVNGNWNAASLLTDLIIKFSALSYRLLSAFNSDQIILDKSIDGSFRVGLDPIPVGQLTEKLVSSFSFSQKVPANLHNKNSYNGKNNQPQPTLLIQSFLTLGFWQKSPENLELFRRYIRHVFKHNGSMYLKQIVSSLLFSFNVKSYPQQTNLIIGLTQNKHRLDTR